MTKRLLAIPILAFAIYAFAQSLQPELTKVERLELENVQLKAQQLNEQQQALNAEYKALVAEIEADHPGFTLNAAGQVVKKTPTPASQSKP